MADYGNGRFPLSMFEHLGGNTYLPAATAARSMSPVEMCGTT